MWLFTSKDGNVMRRDKKRLKLDQVVAALHSHSRQDAAAAGARPSQTHGVAVRKGSESSADVKCNLLTEAELLEQGKEGGGLTGGALALQVAVHPRGGGGTRYRCEGALGPDGLTFRYTTTKLAYLGAPTDADAPHPRSVAGASLNVGRAFSLKCTMNAFNDDVAHRTASIISHLADVGRTKVVRIQADYILAAATDEPTLVSIPLLNTTSLPTPPKHSTTVGSAPSLGASSSSSSMGGASYGSLPKVPTDPTVISMLVRTASLPSVAPDSGLAGKSPYTQSPPGTAKGGRRGGGGKSRGFGAAAVSASAESCGSSTPGRDSSAADTPGSTGGGGGGGGDGGAGGGGGGGARPSTASQCMPSCYRPGPWLRLHPPIAKGFTSDKRQPKQCVCMGDFCSVPVQALKKADADEQAGSRPGSDQRSERRRRKHYTEEEEDSIVVEEVGLPPQGLPLYEVPYRSLLQARAEHVVAKEHAFGNDPNGAALRSALLLQGKPGRPHPQGPQLPKPAEFYASMTVCHSCYVVYCRLDAARARTAQPYDQRSEERASRPTTAGSPPSLSPQSSTGDADGRRSSAAALQRSQTAAASLIGGGREGEGGGARSLGARAASAKELSRSCSSACGLTRACSSSGGSAFGTLSGGIGFERGRSGRRQLRAPARLAQINREDEMGPRQVKRLLAELERRPHTALPLAPRYALSTGKASAVAQALSGALSGGGDDEVLRPPPRAYELTAKPLELTMMGVYDDPEYLQDLLNAQLAVEAGATFGADGLLIEGGGGGGGGGGGCGGGGGGVGGCGGGTASSASLEDGGRDHLQMIMASRSASNLSGVCVGGPGSSTRSGSGSSARGGGRALSRGSSDPSLYDLAGQAPGGLGATYGTKKAEIPEKPNRSETMFARRPASSASGKNVQFAG